MYSIIRHPALRIALIVFVPWASVGAQSFDVQSPESRGPWSWSMHGGAAHQFGSELDNGGEFGIDRLFIEPSLRYSLDKSASVAFALGYGYDSYDFSGSAGFSPWSNVHSWRFSLPMYRRVDSRWTLFGIPTLRLTAERGADFAESITGGAMFGFSYKFSDRFTLGPGVGVLTQMEDDTVFFPFLAVNWKITDTVSLRTGSGLAASLGPGLTLAWRPKRRLEFTVMGRKNRLRFRLDDSGVAPDGIAEDRSFQLFVSAGYQPNQQLSLSLFGGLTTRGELRVNDVNGNAISAIEYDSAGIIGATFRTTF